MRTLGALDPMLAIDTHAACFCRPRAALILMANTSASFCQTRCPVLDGFVQHAYSGQGKHCAFFWFRNLPASPKNLLWNLCQSLRCRHCLSIHITKWLRYLSYAAFGPPKHLFEESCEDSRLPSRQIAADVTDSKTKHSAAAR